MRTSDETITNTLAVLRKHGGNQSEAARELGIARASVQRHMELGTERNLNGGALGGPLPPGQSIIGVSTLYNDEGGVTAQWVKTRQEHSLTDVAEAVGEFFASYKGYAKLPPDPKYITDPNLATVYNLADHHLGLYAWKRETGEDYDIDIGRKVLIDAMTNLVMAAPKSETAVILNLGDFFHSDNNENRTRKSGNILDVDTRYAKVLQVGVELLVTCIELALQKHANVLVRCLPGNHDPYGALALSVAIAAFFHANPRVKVDTDPGPFFWWRFGKVFIGSTHGDMIKHEQMPGVMASMRPKDWGETEYRYIYLGHVHHKSKGGGETAGVIWETFQTLAAKDAWHHQSGYVSGRSMVAITHHKEKGEVFRHTVSVAPK